MGAVFICPHCREEHDDTITPNTLCRSCHRPLLEGPATVELARSGEPGGGSQPALDLPPDTVLGPCRTLYKLGEGAMGAVYRGVHMTLEVPVAVKVLFPTHASRQASFETRFLQEAKLAARIRHPNVVAVMDAGVDEELGLFYIVQEFVDGGSLCDRLGEGSLPVDEALAILEDIARALVAAAKENIIHRDIKPDNIMLSKEGPAKLADLGLAKDIYAQDVELTKSNITMGTPAYMSPEQAEDARSADMRSDIYCLGATLYHMLTGSIPFPATTTINALNKLIHAPTPNPRDLCPGLPTDVTALCMKMMAKSKAHRYQTAEELLQVIHRVRDHRKQGLPPLDLVTGKGMGKGTMLLIALVVLGLGYGAYHFYPALLQKIRPGSSTGPDSRTPHDNQENEIARSLQRLNHILKDEGIENYAWSGLLPADNLPAVPPRLQKRMESVLTRELGAPAVDAGKVRKVFSIMGLKPDLPLSDAKGRQLHNALKTDALLIGRLHALGPQPEMSLTLIRLPQGERMAQLHFSPGNRLHPPP